MTILRNVLAELHAGRDLNAKTARTLFDAIMDGAMSEGAIGAVLGALLVKGESVEELVGAAQAMRARVIAVRCADPNAIDTCGTGGDGVSTFNVSTTAAIIAAAAGATVAKHGNRSSTRVSGSTEILTELGIDVDADAATVERSLQAAGIGYLNARNLHPAMKAVAPVRQAIPARTIFNLLGPLTNPAAVSRQLLGVPAPHLMETMARALLQLGAVYAWIVHGHSAICDVSITGPTQVCEVQGGTIRTFEITPEAAGLTRGALAELIVDTPRKSAEAVLSILRGDRGARRDHALLNAGAALVVAGRAKTIVEGVGQAAQALDTGAAIKKLDQWRSLQGRTSGP